MKQQPDNKHENVHALIEQLGTAPHAAVTLVAEFLLNELKGKTAAEIPPGFQDVLMRILSSTPTSPVSDGLALERSLVVYVDVDDTMVRTVGTKRIPMPQVIDRVKELKADGAVLYCWSTGGYEYARLSAEEFGIQDCFEGFLTKPHVYIDDQEVRDWRRCFWILPSNCATHDFSSLKEQLLP